MFEHSLGNLLLEALPLEDLRVNDLILTRAAFGNALLSFSSWLPDPSTGEKGMKGEKWMLGKRIRFCNHL